jgi:hypothetical protein
MFKKISRVLIVSFSSLVLPGVIAACSGGGSSGGAPTKESDPTESQTGNVTSAAKACTNVSTHDDAQCTGSYLLLDEINDESCSAVNDAAEEAKVGLSTQVPAELPKGSPAKFSWGKTTAKRSTLKRVLDVLEPSAEAHGRTDGEVYMLVFEDKGCKEVVRIFTKQTSWTADAASWSKLSAASGPLTLTIVLATLDNSAVKDGTDAVATKPVTFSIK